MAKILSLFQKTKNKSHATQKGSVLLIALFVIALVEIVIIGLASYHLLSLRYANYFFSSFEGINLALGGEDWAKTQLIADYQSADKNNKQTATIFYLEKTAITHGFIEGVVIDVQGMFNLNNLTSTLPSQEITNNTISNFNESSEYDTQDRFFARAGDIDQLTGDIKNNITPTGENNPHIPNNPFMNFTLMLNALLSDKEGINVKSLSEFVQKQLQLMNYVRSGSGNPMPFSSITQLRAIPNMTSETFQKLLPHLFVLPEVTPLNVNSATLYSLMSLSPKIDKAKATSVIAIRDSLKAFSNTEAFLALEALKQAGISANQVTVRSQYYLATINIRYQDVYLVMNSLLKVVPEKNNYKVNVIWRSFGSL